MARPQARVANRAQTSSEDELKRAPLRASAAQQARRWSGRRWNATPLYPSSPPYQPGSLPLRQSRHRGRKTKQPQLESARERRLQPTPQLPVRAAAPAAKMLATSAKRFGRSYTRRDDTLRPAHPPNSPLRQL